MHHHVGGDFALLAAWATMGERNLETGLVVLRHRLCPDLTETVLATGSRIERTLPFTPKGSLSSIYLASDPITALMEAGRGLISGQPTLTLAAFAIVVGLVAGFVIWAIRGLRRAEAAGAA